MEAENGNIALTRLEEIARGANKRFGTVNLVSTERNIMAGQAVGQTLNYSGMGLSPEQVGATNGLSQIFDLSAYAATMRTTEPVWGQNYPGRAIGQD